MRRLLGIAIVAFLLTAAGAPAGAVPHPDATFRSERVYFHCIGDTKLQNVPSAQGEVAPWDTAPPPGSVTDQAGCGHLEYGIGGDQFDSIFQGTFTGNVRNLTVQLHEMAHSDQQPFGTEVIVKLSVDGTARLTQTTAQLLPVESENSGVTNRAVFSISGLGYDTEEGNGAQVRTFRLTIASPTRGASLWVWDTTEVPAGITFNPPTLAPTVFAAE